MSRSLLRGKIRLVAICGLAGSGKDTLAQGLSTKHGYMQLTFAEPIYKMLNALPYAEHWTSSMSRQEKEKEHPFYGKSPRRMLQTLGTEWGRELIGSDIWLNILQDRMEHKYDVLHKDRFVISDLRFENEALFIKQLGGAIVRVVRDNVQAIATHISEDGFPQHYIDMSINNFTSIEALLALTADVDALAESRRTAA